MSHVDEGLLHAYLDEALENDAEREKVERHLRACTHCRARLEVARADRESAGDVLDVLEPASLDGPPFEEIEARRGGGAPHATGIAGPLGRAGAAGSPRSGGPADSRGPDDSGGSRGTWARSRERLAWAATVVIALGGGWVGHGAWSSLSGPSEGEPGAPAVRFDSMRAPGPLRPGAAARSGVADAAAGAGAAESAASGRAATEGVATGAEREEATGAAGDAERQAESGDAGGGGADGDADGALATERALADASDRAAGEAFERDAVAAAERADTGAAERADAGAVERREVILQGLTVEDADARAGSLDVAAARAQGLLDTLASGFASGEGVVRSERSLEATITRERRDTTLQERGRSRAAVTFEVGGDVSNAAPAPPRLSIAGLRSALRTLESREEAADSRGEWMTTSPAQAAEHLRTAPLDVDGLSWVTMELAADRVPLLRSRYPLPGGEVVELLQAPAPVRSPVTEAERAAAPVAGEGGPDFLPVPVPEGSPPEVVAHFADRNLTVILRGPVPVQVLEALLGRLR